MIYFAYGSNLCLDWLRNRTPSAEILDTGVLSGHALKFHKVSINDHSGKCNAFRTDNSEDVVWGALYEISEQEVRLLDAAEDLGVSYRKRDVQIQSGDRGKFIHATTYFAMEATLSDGAVPFDWYKRLVLRGALSHGFPEAYIDMIRRVKSDQDPNERRRERNLKFTCPEGVHQSPESTE